MKPYYQTELGKLYCGDCLEIMKSIPNNSIKLCLTDPPYDMDSLYLYEGLLKECERILTNDGNLIFLYGHHQLFYILEIKTTLRKWWIGWLNHNRSNRIFGKNVIVKGKPWLWYNNKIREKTSKVPMDTITLDKKDWSKKIHKWEQPVKFFEHFVEFLTNKDDKILDCYLGSGTTAVACEKLNRRWVGIEISEKYCEIAKQRIKAEYNQLKFNLA